MIAGKLRPLILGSAAAALLATAAACNRGEESVATVEKQQASPVQTVQQPITVTGCLRAGDAANTFVVTTPEQPTGEAAATYELVQPQETGVDLAQLVGRQVEVAGTLQTRQRVTTRSTSDPPSKGPEGTSGQAGQPRPEVSTTTELDIKRIDVQRVTPVAGECTP